MSPVDLTRAQAINGWMDRKELRWLAGAARACTGAIIEVGSYEGRTTRALADNTSATVYAVDPWDGRGVVSPTPGAVLTDAAFPVFCLNLADHIAAGRVVPVKAILEEAVPKFADLGLWRPPAKVGGADLVFIDADHHYATIRRNIDIALRLLRPGGIIAGHDFGHAEWPGVKRAVDEAFGNATRLCRLIWWVQTAEAPGRAGHAFVPPPEEAAAPTPAGGQGQGQGQGKGKG